VTLVQVQRHLFALVVYFKATDKISPVVKRRAGLSATGYISRRSAALAV